MSIKTETIEVRRCDFCISTGTARTCQHCDKDACSNCGKIYKLLSEYWSENPFVITTSAFSTPAPLFSAFICHECERGDLANSMLSFGFDGGAREKKTA